MKATSAAAGRLRALAEGRLRRISASGDVSKEDTALIAAQLADLTARVEELAEQLKGFRQRADDAQERADTQQERDHAARELTEISDRLQAAANALRDI
jgi:hypothetical protein